MHCIALYTRPVTTPRISFIGLLRGEQDDSTRVDSDREKGGVCGWIWGIKRLKDGRIEGWKDDDSAGLVCMSSRGIGGEMGLTELEG